MNGKLSSTFKPIQVIQVGTLAALCVTLGWQSDSIAAVFTIDDFTDSGSPNTDFCNGLGASDQCVFTNPFPATLTDTQTGLTGVEGGSRQLDITAINGNNSFLGITNTTSGTAPRPDHVVFTNGSGVQSTASITYDNFNTANGSPDFLNIDVSAFDQFQFLISSADLNLNIELELSSGLSTGGTPVVKSKLITNVGAGVDVETTAIFDLTDVDFSGVDFTDIDRVKFTLSGASDIDAQITTVEFSQSQVEVSELSLLQVEVPEPSLLLGFKLLGLSAIGGKGIKRVKRWFS